MKPSEVAALAELIFSDVDRRPLTDDVRSQIAEQAGELGLSSFRPFFASLEKDPAHPGAYYLMVDAMLHGTPQTYLLRFAFASGSAPALFSDSILIGRMRPAGEREVLVNAIPFGPSDSENIQSFTQEVDGSFLPRSEPQPHAAPVAINDIERDIPAAFAKLNGHGNGTRECPVLSVGDTADRKKAWTVAVWSAIRCGWRSGYVID